jgi:hypothetical protein
MSAGTDYSFVRAAAQPITMLIVNERGTGIASWEPMMTAAVFSRRNCCYNLSGPSPRRSRVLL